MRIAFVAVAAVALMGCPKPAPVTLPYAVGPDGLPVVNPDPEAQLPLDPGVRTGRLDNGLTWYIEENPRPAHRAELRMVVKAGSILEDDDQRGIAHFLEHMAFNGTERYPGTSMISEVEALGSRFGAHVNASTGFDETVYQLQVPTDLRKGKGIETALGIFSQQVTALAFDADECSREVGVVTEEWRLDQGLGQRIQDTMFPLLFAGSRYIDRLPIGTADSVKTFSCEAAERFWRDWYRPDLMAVMVVGDVDADEVEVLIHAHFDGLTNPPSPRPRAYERVPDHDEVLVGVLADPEMTGSNLSIFDKVDSVEDNHQRAYRQFLLEQIVWVAFNERLAVRALPAGSPFVAVNGGQSDMGHERAVQSVSCQSKEGRELEALEVMLEEIERLRRYGFTAGEIERARAALQLNMRQYYDERDTTDSAENIEELLRVFLTREPMPGVDYEFALSQVYLPEIDVDEANAWVRERLLTGRSRVVSVAMPAKPGLAVPTEDQIRALVEAAPRKNVAPPEAEGTTEPLMTTLPTPGTSTEVARDAELGTVTWRLGNGITVIVKPTPFQVDEVLFSASSPGGTAAVSDADYIPAITAADIARRSGVGEHDLIDLARHTAGKDVHVEPYISTFHEGLTGGASKHDLETMFQLIHLQITAPRFDPEAYEAERQAREEMMRNRASNPDDQFEDAYMDALWGGNPRYTNWSPDDLAKMDLARSAAVWRDRFGDVGDFTFVLVGSVDPATLRPLVERYLATLPSAGRVEQVRDDGARQAEGQVKREVVAGSAPRAHVVLHFHGPFVSTWESRNTLDAMGEVLQSALSEILREQRGGTYGVGVDVGVREAAQPLYQVEIDFQCDPARVDELVEAMWSVVDLVRRTAANKEGVAIMQEQRKRDFETDSRTNLWWVQEIAGAVRRGEDPRALLDVVARDKAITGDAMRAMAMRVLDRSRYVLLIQRPLVTPK